jgi:CelD/BcsL family acetyltransferase involved in cellulose biosynthesis
MVAAKRYKPAQAHALSTEVLPWRAWGTIRHEWDALVERSPHASFFLSVDWVDSWLATFGEALDPTLVVFKGERDRIVGACLLVVRPERRGPFVLRRVYLNTSGEGDTDSPCLEFNTLLCEPGYEAQMALAIRDVLDDLRWDQFLAPGVVEGSSLDALTDAFAPLDANDTVKPSFYVDLDELRKSERDFVESMASRERTQYRQSVRKYSEIGPLEVDTATTTDDALARLDELAALHQAGWQERGFGGAFASELFRRFHRDLVQRCAPDDRVQLVRLRAGEETVGVLYNYIFRGKLYFYQCGYNYGNKKLRPGVITHIFAIRLAAERGLAEYDLMAGDVDYKRRLASKSRNLHWIRWDAPGVKMRTFELLRRTKNKLQERRAQREEPTGKVR